MSSADSAANRASSLGLNGGSIIYYDMEHYTNYEPGCDTNVSAAVNSFLSGWVVELAHDGYSTGVYESASNLLSVASDGNPPSYVWIGGGGFSAGSYGCHGNVWGNAYVPDGYWTFDQRLYQYTAGHSENWGGVAIGIDSDAAIGNATPRSYDDSGEPDEGGNEVNSPTYDVPPC